jgi:uncharacterized protein (DUF2236 family)
MGCIGWSCRDAAAAATHAQSGRTYANRHHGLRRPAGVSSIGNHAAIARRRTRSDTQPKQTKSLVTVTTPIVLAWPLRSGLEAATRALFDLDELAEPRVRTGVWEHTTFRVDPIRRLRRTGLAAMVIYGARGKAEAMIARVRRMHDRVAGSTPAGKPYRANDPELLNWVQATAAYGFLQAYHAYVRPLSDLERDRYYTEGRLAASLYGASAPTSEAALEMRFEAMSNRLERSDILFEFLAIMRSAPILPLPLRPLQPLLVRASVAVIPHWLQMIVGPHRPRLTSLGGWSGAANWSVRRSPCS